MELSEGYDSPANAHEGISDGRDASANAPFFKYVEKFNIVLVRRHCQLGGAMTAPNWQCRAPIMSKERGTNSPISSGRGHYPDGFDNT